MIMGPVVYQVLNKNDKLTSFIDGFVVTSIAGLFLTHIFSHQYENLLLVIFLLLLGFLGPNILGFAFHEFVDGAVLSSTVGNSDLLALQIAVIIHRLPAGLTLWWILRPKYGFKFASIIVGLMLILTSFGFFFADSGFKENEIISYLQVFVAGSILHVVFFQFHLDQHHHNQSIQGCKHCDKKKQENPFLEGLGNVLGIILVVFVYLMTKAKNEHTDHHHIHTESLNYLDTFIHHFIHLFQVSAPALFLAFVLSSIVTAFLNFNSFKWINKGSNFLQAFKGMSFGLPLPICSCGILPFYKSLVNKGISPAAGIAFLIATPEIGLDAILISFPLLGVELTFYRIICAIVLALVVSLLLTPYTKQYKNISEEISEKVSLKEKLKKGFSYGFLKLADTTVPWILLGIIIGAIISPFAEVFNLNLPYGLDVVVFGLLGIVVYVCASGATPLVAVLIAGGVSPGAGIAFLLTGPATNISTFGVLAEIHNREFALRFALLMTFLAWVLGYFVNFSIGDVSFAELLVPEDHSTSIWHQISAYFVTIVFLYSLLRQGGRKFISRVS